VKYDNFGRHFIDNIIRAENEEEAEAKTDAHYFVEVDANEFVVILDANLIKTLKEALIKNGYDVPETEIGWSDLINDLLKEKIIEDYGEEALQ
jgi:hypothetical protein